MASISARRICLIGPECTGKTTLAARLSRDLLIPWVPEFAREYAEARNNELTAADVEPIARAEMANLDRVEGPAILDTDLVSTVVYARHYYRECPEWIVDEARRRAADLYLLLDTDLPWTPDPARDSPGDAREDLFDAFRATLEELETRFDIVSGSWEERLARISELVHGHARSTS